MNLKALVKKCMNSTLYCAVATYGKGNLWAAPVVFAYDNNLNLYFISDPKSRHMINISRNKKVAVAIYTTKQKITSSKIGVQLEGNAEWVNGPLNVLKAYKLYFSRNVKWRGATLKYFKSAKALVKINTTDLFYFNNDMFGLSPSGR